MPDFYYRSNRDDTTDSICMQCFCTVATARTFEQLRASEQAHRCVQRVAVLPKSNRPLHWLHR